MRRVRENPTVTDLYLLAATGPLDHPKVTRAHWLEFIMAGASAVQVGTASFANPRAPLDVLEGIERFMEKEGLKSITEIIGIARR